MTTRASEQSHPTTDRTPQPNSHQTSNDAGDNQTPENSQPSLINKIICLKTYLPDTEYSLGLYALIFGGSFFLGFLLGPGLATVNSVADRVSRSAKTVVTGLDSIEGYLERDEQRELRRIRD